MKLRLDLLAQQLQRLHHLLIRDLGAAIHLGQDPVEAELLLQPHQPVGDPLGRADNDLVAQGLVIGDGLQPASAGGAVLDRADTGAGRRILEPLAEVAVEKHDALFGLVASLFLGLGDINRSPQKHLALARVASLFPRRAIGLDVWSELRKRAEAHRDKHAMAELANGRKGIGAVRGDADLWPRLLIGLWRQTDIIEFVELSGVRKGIFGPGALQDFESFGKALPALAVGDAVRLVCARKAAAPDAKDQPAQADLIDGSGFLGNAQRMAQWQDLHAGPDLHVFGARGDGAGDRQWCSANRSVGSNVEFGQPHRVESPTLGGIDLCERLGEGVRLALSRRALELMKHAELERHLLFSLSLAARAATGAVDRRKIAVTTIRLMTKRCQSRNKSVEPTTYDPRSRAGPPEGA